MEDATAQKGQEVGGKQPIENPRNTQKKRKNQKQGHNDDIERRKRKALYGTRASSKIFESAAMNNSRPWLSGIGDKTNNEEKKSTQEIPFRQKIIISHDNKVKAIFDAFILGCVAYSCVTSMGYAAFGQTKNTWFIYIDMIVEIFFYLDLFLNFLQSVKDPETYEEIKEIKKIAKLYIFKGWFFIDAISVFPFGLFTESGGLTKLFRLFRLPRLLKLIDISRVSNLLKQLMSNTSRDEKIVAQYMLLYVIKIIRLIFFAIIITYFIGCIWYWFCYSQSTKGDEGETGPDGEVQPEQNFIAYNNLNEYGDNHKLIVSCYYALTTLSTVGYGDYYPISNMERIIAVIIMLGGVAFFSYIMGNFIEIISNYEKKMGVVDKSSELHTWLMNLTRFTNNQPLPKSITSQIEANFSYYWAQDRLACLNTDDQYLEALPKKIKNQIITVYLFSDIFKQFKRFFNIESVKDTRFLYDIAFGFMPRKFEPTEEDKMIYDEEEEVPEMYFIMEGIVGIGFSLIANGYSKDQFSIPKRQTGPCLICDHYVVNQQKSQFIYMAIIKDVKCYALTKTFLHDQVFPKYPEIKAKMQTECFNLYKKQIFKPINEQRKLEIIQINKKSVYRQIQLNQNKDNDKGEIIQNEPQVGLQGEGGLFGNTNIDNKMVAERIVNSNLKENIQDLQGELNIITNSIRDMIDNCDDKLSHVIKQVEKTNQM